MIVIGFGDRRANGPGRARTDTLHRSGVAFLNVHYVHIHECGSVMVACTSQGWAHSMALYGKAVAVRFRNALDTFRTNADSLPVAILVKKRKALDLSRAETRGRFGGPYFISMASTRCSSSSLDPCNA